MVLSGSFMIFHLLYFKYVTVTKETLKKVSVKTILLCLPLLCSAMLLFNLVSELSNLTNVLEDLFISLCKTPLGFLSVAIFAPIVEELLFRGTLEEKFLQQGYSPTKAIIISSLIFGLIHLNPVQIPFAFCIGSVFGWLYYKTRSVVPGIIGHFLNNASAATLMATLPPKEAKTTTIELIGTIPTYLIIVLSFLGMIVSYKYLNFYFNKTKSKQSA